MKIKNKFLASLKLLLVGSVFFLTNCKKDPDFAEVAPSSLKNSSEIQTLSSSTTIGANAFYLEKALPAGYVKNGSIDYTKYLQSAIDKNAEVVFPAFPIMVNSSGLRIRSNKIVTFLNGAKLILKPTSVNSYRILNILDATNVTINSPVIQGDRTNHLSTGGRYGVGIGIYGSSKITVNNPVVTDTYGDGIYVGSTSLNPYSKNIKLTNVYVKNAARNGMSITSADSLQIDSAYFGYSGLTGFDMEGNTGKDLMRNITLNNVRTEFSANNGLAIGLSRTFDTVDKSIGEINIINHTDVSSARYSVKVSVTKPSTGVYGTITGKVKFINPTWIKPGAGRPNHYYVTEPLFITNIMNPKFQDLTGNWLTPTATTSLIKKNIRKGICTITF